MRDETIQQAWIDYYKQGKTATEAARLAGYRGNNHDVIGAQNLVKLSEYIVERDAILEKPRIADMDEINTLFTNLMRDTDAVFKDRLKASELRARSAGMFTDKVQISGGLESGFEKLDDIMKQLQGDNSE